MTAPVKLSDFVARCQSALAEYQRLRFLGIDHDIAILQSGFRDAVIGKPIDQRRLLLDARAAAAGKDAE
jgi:hypothetical protein